MPNGFQKPVATRRSFLPSAVHQKMCPPSPSPEIVAPSRTDQLVCGAEVFAHAEVEIALGIEAEPGQAVVRIIALGVEKSDALLDVGLAGALRILEPQDLVARGQVDRAVGMHGYVHGVPGAFEEGGETVRLAVAFRVLDHANAVELGPLVVGGSEVRMALDDQQPAPGVEIQADRMHDVRRLGEQLDDETRVGGFGEFGLLRNYRGGDQ